MKAKFSQLGVLTPAVTLALVGATSVIALPGKSDQAGAKRISDHVILIDWDGFSRAYLEFSRAYLERVPTPNLDMLAATGSLSMATGTFKTLSNPSRASMSTGAFPETHGNAAFVYDRETNRAIAQTRFLAAETIAQSIARAGLTQASVQWYMVQDHGVTYGDPRHLYVQPVGECDQRTDVAIDILHRRPVDSNGTQVTVPKIPDFLALYCSELDSDGHKFGPNNPILAQQLAFLDQQLGRLIQATKDVGIFDKTTFLLTGDHGMTGWSKTLQPQVLAALRQAGYHPQIVLVNNSPDPTTDVIIVPIIRVGSITLRGDADTPEDYARIKKILADLPEIEHVVDRDELQALHASPKEGDMVAEAKPPYAFAEFDLPAGEEQGSHASLREIHMPLFLSGTGICPGQAPNDPSLVDVAPTIAHLLGIRPPADAQGRVLTEALNQPGCPSVE